jgi:hypothetical protein
MKPMGSDELTIKELPGELRIKYARHAGWIERIVAPAIAVSMMMVAWFWRMPILGLGASGLVALLFLRWVWGHESVLRVFPERLVASSYLRDAMEVLRSSVQTIQWLRQDSLEDGGIVQKGLYISRTGRPECILPRISEEQAIAITDAISRLFPEYPVNKPIPGSIWFQSLPDMTAFTIPGPIDLDPNRKT